MLRKIPRLLAAFAAAFSLVIPTVPPALAQETRLHHAARDGVDEVRDKLPQRKVNAITPQGETALHWALQVGNLATPEDTADRNGAIYLLLEAGADPFIQDQNGVSPTHLAVMGEHLHLNAPRAPRGSLGRALGYNGSLMVLQKGIEKYRAGQGDSNLRDNNGDTPLHLILSPENPYPREATAGAHSLRDIMINRIMLAGADPTVFNHSRFTPLHAATRHGAYELERLLDANNRPNPNVQDGDGLTPLHWALSPTVNPSRGTVKDIVRLLLQRGADPTVLDNNGESPLELARRRGLSADIVAMLSQEEDDVETRLIEEIKNLARGRAPDDSEIMRLIDAGVNADRPSPNQVPALHWATTYGQTEVVRRLVEAGQDVNRRNPNGYSTAAHLAVQLRNADMVMTLIELGADFSLLNGNNEAPFCQRSMSAERRANLAYELVDSSVADAETTRSVIEALSVCLTVAGG